MATRKKTAPARERSYHHGDLRSSLITAALLLIEQHGVKGFSMKDAAAMAGVSTAAPYRHFAEKEALLRAISEESFGLFGNTLKAAYDEARTPKTRLEDIGVAYVMFALRNPARFSVMFGRNKDVGNAPVKGGPTGFLLLQQAVAALLPRSSAARRNDLLLTCWSVVHGFATLQMEGAFAVMGGVGDVERQLRRSLGVIGATAKTSEPKRPGAGRLSGSVKTGQDRA